MIHVDLGCGESKKKGAIGIDCVAQPGVDHVCQLGFEPIPLPDNYADKVTAYDVLEHIPKIANWKEDGKWNTCFPHIQLFNEVWRILKPNGEFDTLTPVSEPGLHGRFVHVSTWNQETFLQVTKLGCDFQRGHMKAYGFNGEFRLISSRRNGTQHLHIVLQAVK